jgi:hypothetical protein
MSDNGKVNTHGKEYETVASRVQRFRKDFPDRSLLTELVSRDDDAVVVKALISNGERTLATGHAEESRTSSQINMTSALENAETSAIGRALAAFGYAGTEYASADEVANAVKQRAQSPSKPAVGTAAPADRPISAAEAQMLFGMAKTRAGLVSKEDAVQFIREEAGIELAKAKKSDVARIKAVFGDVEVEE